MTGTGSADLSTPWALTIDCSSPSRLAAFWSEALGYVPAPPPAGYATREEWLADLLVPETEWDDGAYLVDPRGGLPALTFLRVPEAKTVKNRLHLDLQVSGGRHLDAGVRRERIEATARRLVACGASEVARAEQSGVLDHVVLADPEGNEFCLV